LAAAVRIRIADAANESENGAGDGRWLIGVGVIADFGRGEAAQEFAGEGYTVG
jgi:hypothetical protein